MVYGIVIPTLYNHHSSLLIIINHYQQSLIIIKPSLTTISTYFQQIYPHDSLLIIDDPPICSGKLHLSRRSCSKGNSSAWAWTACRSPSEGTRIRRGCGNKNGVKRWDTPRRSQNYGCFQWGFLWWWVSWVEVVRKLWLFWWGKLMINPIGSIYCKWIHKWFYNPLQVGYFYNSPLKMLPEFLKDGKMGSIERAISCCSPVGYGKFRVAHRSNTNINSWLFVICSAIHHWLDFWVIEITSLVG